MKKNIILYSIIAVLAMGLIISMLYASGKGIALEEDKITYDELQTEIANKEVELYNIKSDLEDNKEFYDALRELAEEHDELIDSIAEYKSDVESLETEIKEKENQLKKIEGKLVKVVDEPIKVNPGTFYFGDDIESGRYKVTHQEGQRGNIYFRGDESFAETFGKGDLSVEEYTFNAYDGEEIQFDIPALLYPVE